MTGRHLILYDGLCGLCNRSNRFILRQDRMDRFRFAALQSTFARDLVARLGGDPDELTTLYVVPDFQEPERLLKRSDAVLFVFRELGGLWRGAGLMRLLPRPLRDGLYHVVSTRRYRFFGRFDACPLPTPETRRKFLAVE